LTTSVRFILLEYSGELSAGHDDVKKQRIGLQQNLSEQVLGGYALR
jgi:hypothetical protein